MKNPWQRRAGNLCSRLNADHRNHVLLADPWSYRAHIIVQSWRIIASQGRLNPNLQPKTKVTTWKQSAERMKTRIQARRMSRLLDKTTWNYWANHVPYTYIGLVDNIDYSRIRFQNHRYRVDDLERLLIIPERNQAIFDA